MPGPPRTTAPSRPPRPRWLRRLIWTALLAALALLCLAATVRWLLPLRTQPPTGPYGVATRAWLWTDTDRSDPLRATPDRPRRLPTALYHPIEQPFRARLPTDREVPDFAGPLIVIVHGALGTARSHLSLAHQLASEGYLVLAADHPGIALFSRPGSSLVLPPAEIRGLLWQTARMPSDRRLSARAQGPLLPLLTADARFLGDRGALVLRRSGRPIAYAGYGLGGLAALGACERDPACATAVLLDAPLPSDLDPPTRPVLAITSSGVEDPSPLGPRSAHVALPHAGTLDLTDTPLQVRGSVLRTIVSARHATAEGRDGQSIVRAVASTWLAHHLRGAPLDLQTAAAPWASARVQRGTPSP